MTDERKAELLEKLIQEALNQDEEIFLGTLAGGLDYVGMTEDEAKELGLEEWI